MQQASLQTGSLVSLVKPVPTEAKTCAAMKTISRRILEAQVNMPGEYIAQRGSVDNETLDALERASVQC